MPRKQKIRIHISVIGGLWYAMAGNNNPDTRRALVPAISYIRRMNQKRMKGGVK